MRWDLKERGWGGRTELVGVSRDSQRLILGRIMAPESVKYQFLTTISLRKRIACGTVFQDAG